MTAAAYRAVRRMARCSKLALDRSRVVTSGGGRLRDDPPYRALVLVEQESWDACPENVKKVVARPV